MAVCFREVTFAICFYDPVYMPSGLFYPYQMDISICQLRGVSCGFLILFLYQLPRADRVFPDQTPLFAASDLDLHYLPDLFMRR